ncbi:MULTISPECIES: hypothetical protein [Dyella]|uniref:DUF4168 domain-containing protein n=2 Tax=Dyella TaxID=231454 RepID=A0A4R0Z2V8_9GAMM|nr:MULTISPECIES: hypothetical protein [Dyella]TBR38872.1 hypothetical protein EYV96_01070 [Dyella terrae]TCI13536.1 hypothetical protein EZM97_09800 [Dyella soli]
MTTLWPAVRKSFHRLAIAALVAWAMGPAVSFAQSGQPTLPDSDKQAIKDYNLTEDVLTRLAAATKDARQMGIKPQAAPDPSKVHNLDDLANQAIASDPKIGPLIKKYGFTPRDFMIANIALVNAIIVVQSRSNPDMAKSIDQSKVNMNNVVFIEQHQQQIQAMMQQ